MKGLHLTADLRGCDASQPLMHEPDALRTLCISSVKAAGLAAVGELFHRFTPAPEQSQGGITGVVLLAESHLAVHTWPELSAVTLDVYVCNLGQDNSSKAEQLLLALSEAFRPTVMDRQQLVRGR
ncbi:MAG TPA: adenosylmethionine decarboxylase [Burkholderiaceae bacterium]|jgi:S-adenosylmethionine decarboxylase proenzyme